MASKIQWNPEAFLTELSQKENYLLTEVCKEVNYEAQGFVPVDTGALQDDIKYEIDTLDKIGYVGNDLFYSIYVELGTRKMMAQPYLRKALDVTFTNFNSIASRINTD